MKPTLVPVVAPFADYRWANFWLTAPSEGKINQSLYRATIKKKFPYLASLPTKNSLGARSQAGKILKNASLRTRSKLAESVRFFSHSDPRVNYVDYGLAFQTRSDYQEVLGLALDLLERLDVAPWLDFRKLQAGSLVGVKNYDASCLILIGLALNLEIELREATESSWA